MRAFAVAVAMHLDAREYLGDVPLQKMNVLLVGPTGVGKTEMVRRLAEVIDAPFASLPATAMTQPGFTGFDPDQILKKLVQKAGSKDRSSGPVRDVGREPRDSCSAKHRVRGSGPRR